jgi:hypothetical protein
VPLPALMTMNRMTIIKNLTYEREMSRLHTTGQLLADEVEENMTRGVDDEIDDILALSARSPGASVQRAGQVHRSRAGNAAAGARLPTKLSGSPVHTRKARHNG